MSGGLRDSPCAPQAHGKLKWTDGSQRSCPLCSRPRCTSKSKTRPGERCRRNPITGGKTCVIHGSGTEAAKAAAAEAVRDQAAAAQLEALVWRQDAPPVQSAVLELQLLAGQLRQALSVLGGRLNQSVVCPTCHRGPEPLDGPTARVWTTVVREQRQLLAAMEGLGLAERQVQVEQEKAQIVTAAFLGALGEVPGLLPVDRNLMLRGFLSRLGRGPDAITAGEVVPS